MSIPVGRAPVLTLWGTVVAERLGHSTETALTLGRALTGSAARIKARNLGISTAKHDWEERASIAAQMKPDAKVVRLLGRDIPVLEDAEGVLLADDGGKPASPRGVQAYLVRSFGGRLEEALSAMQFVAASWAPEELNRIGFRLYEKFRPEVPRGAEGWGAKGELFVARILQMAARAESKCPDCGGTGQITEVFDATPASAPPDCGPPKACPRCGGSGVVDPAKC